MQALAKRRNLDGALRLIDMPCPIRRGINGPRRQRRMASSGLTRSLRETPMGPVARGRHEARAQRVALHVAQERQQVRIILDWRSLEPPLVDGAAADAAARLP